MKKAVYIIVCLLLTAIAAGCRTPKLSEADAQFQRGEYYDASVTYKKGLQQTAEKGGASATRRSGVQDGTLL